jgi:energy-coupling factor transporter ATP-binding protein EcfA2
LFDVFLSHNSDDKNEVETLARRLEDEAKLNPWLDKWNLVPGEPWQEALEQALDQSSACAVFIGPSAIGPWHNEEMRVALDRRGRERAFRVIPVLLPGAKMPDRGELPAFLTRLTWVDFRSGLDDGDAFHLFVSGVTGKPPGRRARTPIAAPERGAAVTAVECPYRGLEMFGEEHARFFFGREALTQHLVEALRPTRFLAIIGPSGSGKSSLARAGLLPRLRAGALPGSEKWTRVVLKPGGRPLEELAVMLAQAVRNHDPITLLKGLESDERALHLETRRRLMGHSTSNEHIGARARPIRYFILIDQFEEIFTICGKEEERIQFIKNLRYAGTVDGGQSIVVITMRADFFHHAAKYSDLAELLSSHQFIVSPMDETELRRAIEEPAREVGLRFEFGLVERILKDIGHEPGALPLMEHALFELYENRRGETLTQQAYDENGGVQGALARRAESFLKESGDRQEVVRRIMLRLTQPGEGTEDTRRRAMKNELLTINQDQAAVEEILDKLMGARLITASTGAGGEEWIDVAHEALIRGWPSLGRWIDEDREGLRIHKRLTEDAREWQRQNHNESFVYSGPRLAQVLEWRKDNEIALNQLEREFLHSCVETNDRARRLSLRRSRSINGALILIIALICAATFVILNLRNQRGKAQIIAEQEKALLSGVEIALESLSRTEHLYEYVVVNNRITDILIVEENGNILDSLIKNHIGRKLQDIKIIPPNISVSGLVTDQSNFQALLLRKDESQYGDRRAVAFLMETAVSEGQQRETHKRMIIVITK